MEILGFFVLFCLTYIVYARVEPTTHNFFNVVDFGAVGDGKTDDSQAFGKAWNAACNYLGQGTPILSAGKKKIFVLKPMFFEGPCKSPSIHFQILGNLVGPSTIPEWNKAINWLTFTNIDGLTVDGGGIVGGRGAVWWPCKNDLKKCGTVAPTAMEFMRCNGLHLSGLHFYNNPKNHISVRESNGARLFHLNITAPEDSPNTDGIDISNINDVQIYNSTIATGDDCIAMTGRTSNVNISYITCGPGNGISIGSLGKDGTYSTVEHIHVYQSTFIRSSNGARIKTWQGGKGYVRDITFQDLNMQSVEIPIIIDQYYCGSVCRNQSEAVKVSDVTFERVYGTATKDAAIKLACSESVPCTNIIVKDVNLTSSDASKQVTSCCLAVRGPACTSCTPKVPCLGR